MRKELILFIAFVWIGCASSIIQNDDRVTQSTTFYSMNMEESWDRCYLFAVMIFGHESVRYSDTAIKAYVPSTGDIYLFVKEKESIMLNFKVIDPCWSYPEYGYVESWNEKEIKSGELDPSDESNETPGTKKIIMFKLTDVRSISKIFIGKTKLDCAVEYIKTGNLEIINNIKLSVIRDYGKKQVEKVEAYKTVEKNEEKKEEKKVKKKVEVVNIPTL